MTNFSPASFNKLEMWAVPVNISAIIQLFLYLSKDMMLAGEADSCLCQYLHCDKKWHQSPSQMQKHEFLQTNLFGNFPYNSV